MLLSPDYERLRSPGPANAGHETLACSECHREARGTIRQQFQANARWLIGLRQEPVDFGLLPVSSNDCIDCHERPTDRHPIYRFLEPRFARARDAIAPQRCMSCHAEHTGRRVTIQNGFCKQCHDELVVPNDPAEPTHAGIIAQRQWDACLRCHDFHGNHRESTPRTLLEGVDASDLARYLEGGPSPWSGKKRHSARNTRSE